MKKIKKVPDMLRDAAQVYEERAKLYGDNYKEFGDVMQAMFLNGMTIESQGDWNRLGVFVQMMAKMTRYANNWQRGGHADSLVDIAVYTTMLRELDALYQGPEHDLGAFTTQETKSKSAPQKEAV